MRRNVVGLAVLAAFSVATAASAQIQGFGDYDVTIGPDLTNHHVRHARRAKMAAPKTLYVWMMAGDYGFEGVRKVNGVNCGKTPTWGCRKTIAQSGRQTLDVKMPMDGFALVSCADYPDSEACKQGQ